MRGGGCSIQSSKQCTREREKRKVICVKLCLSFQLSSLNPYQSHCTRSPHCGSVLYISIAMVWLSCSVNLYMYLPLDILAHFPCFSITIVCYFSIINIPNSDSSSPPSSCFHITGRHDKALTVLRSSIIYNFFLKEHHKNSSLLEPK